MQFIKRTVETEFFIGPVLDADGLPVTTATSADFRYVLNGSASAIPSGISITHSINGHYVADFASPIIDSTKMFSIIVGNASLAMPPADFTVLTEAAWDAWFSATAGLNVNVISWAGQPAQLDNSNRPAVSVLNYYNSLLDTWIPIDGPFAQVKSISDVVNVKIDTMLILDGAVWQFTVNALELGPEGGGGAANISVEDRSITVG